jgi:hypothetical protein
VGIFGNSLLSNDHALDFVDLVKSSADPVSVVREALDAVASFYERKAAGLAPRLQTDAERDEMIILVEKGMLENNPHVSRELLVQMVEDFKRLTNSSEPIVVDDGEEEISKACVSALVINASLSGHPPPKLRVVVAKLLPHKLALPLDQALNVLNVILAENEVSSIMGVGYKENVRSLASELEKCCFERVEINRLGPN